MENSENQEKAGFLQGVRNFFAVIDHGVSAFGSCVFKIRKLLMTLPVLIGLGYLTKKNAELLPNPVGINLQADGTYSVLISKKLIK